MKKKILTFLFAICLILPCAFMLTACGGDSDKNFNVNINTFKNSMQTGLQDGVKEIRLVDATGMEDYTICTHIGDELGLEVQKFEVEKGKKLVLLVTLEHGYEINDVTIKADGYNGGRGLSSNKAEGLYTTLAYRLTPKLQLVGRYDQFKPNLDYSADIRREYTAGLNYFIKGQALKLMLNYVFCQNDVKEDSHRIILGTQILL